MGTLWKAAAALTASAISLVAHGQSTLADVRIFDRTQGRPLQMYWHEGQAYVVGKPGNEYEIVVRNRAGDDLLAVVAVDGVNVVNGKTAGYHQRGYIVPVQDRTRIRGWRKSPDETAAFYFTSIGDSYAGRTGRPDDVGVIGVALFERARRYEAPPVDTYPGPHGGPYGGPKRGESHADAPPSAKGYSVPSESLGTGHGRRESSPARHADFDRASEQPSEVLTIRYDSYRNLVAQGVIPRYGRRDAPQAFPGGYVPDPPYRRY